MSCLKYDWRREKALPARDCNTSLDMAVPVTCNIQSPMVDRYASADLLSLLNNYIEQQKSILSMTVVQRS
jgi:hypothetical protein